MPPGGTTFIDEQRVLLLLAFLVVLDLQNGLVAEWVYIALYGGSEGGESRATYPVPL